MKQGPNELSAQKKRGLLTVVLEVVREPMFIMLIVAGGLYLLLGDATEAVMLLGFVYGGFLSVGAVLLEELTYRRYPRLRDLLTLLAFAVLENLGYRQLVLYYRFQGIIKFLFGSRRWEKVAHAGAGAQG